MFMVEAQLPLRVGSALDLFNSCSKHAIDCHKYLMSSKFSRNVVISRVKDKKGKIVKVFECISIRNGTERKTPVNQELFIWNHSELEELNKSFIAEIKVNNGKGCSSFSSLSKFDIKQFNKYIYTLAMSFSILKKIQTPGDKKVAGSFLEYLAECLICLAIGKRIQTSKYKEPIDGNELSINLDMWYRKKNSQIIGMPVKLSTRERNTQLFFHHFLLSRCESLLKKPSPITIPLICNEYNAGKVNNPKESFVNETCIPGTWRTYNTLVPLHGVVCYLDIPRDYDPTPKGCPEFVTWGDFFFKRIDQYFQ